MALEVRVESAATGGLLIIDHVPPDRPCRLEGRNGIGKSALVRLLVLAGGSQPYTGQPASWRSLRKLIGKTVLTITGLAGEHSTATITFTPNHWPDEPVETVGDWLGVATLDGQEVPARRLFELLVVIHLSGTERLIDTLKQQSGRLAVALAGVKARLDGLEDQRAKLGELDEQLQFVSPRLAASERARSEQVAGERRTVEEEIRTAQPVAEDLSRASAFIALVETGDAADHQRRLQESRTELEAARQRMAAAEAKHDAAVAALGRGTTAQREVGRIERRLRAIGREMDDLLARQGELDERLEALQIATDAEHLDEGQRARLSEAFNPARERQRCLQVLAARNHRTTTENRLLDDVRVVLDDAVEGGMGLTVLASINGQPITVTELRDGLGFLNEVGDHDLEDLSAVTRELAELTEIAELFARRTSRAEEGEQLRLKLQRLELEAAAHDELREKATQARVALDAASAEVRGHLMQIGSLSRSTLGGADVVDVEAHIRELLSKHGVEAAGLPTALAAAQRQMLDLEARLKGLNGEAERLAASEARRRVQRESLRHRSERAEDLGWLSQLAAVLPSETTGAHYLADWPDETWQRVADHVAASRSALRHLASDVAGLESLAPQLPTQANRTNRLASAIKAVVEADALAELSAAPIVEALFDGGEVRRVNLDEDSITWTTPVGETRTRPLAAFSSGEQALGFLRARLQQIADQPVSNRLVFLDEFGAFISADRRRPLADLLTSDELRTLAEQVVVVLPLQSDYAAELDQTTGALHELYAERARAVSEHGYFTEAFIR